MKTKKSRNKLTDIHAAVWEHDVNIKMLFDLLLGLAEERAKEISRIQRMEREISELQELGLRTLAEYLSKPKKSQRRHK